MRRSSPATGEEIMVAYIKNRGDTIAACEEAGCSRTTVTQTVREFRELFDVEDFEDIKYLVEEFYGKVKMIKDTSIEVPRGVFATNEQRLRHANRPYITKKPAHKRD